SNQLIDFCLNYFVLPRLDYSSRKLIIRGDSESCLQCLSNLILLKQKTQLPNKWHYIDKDLTEKLHNHEFSQFISIKMEEFALCGEQTVQLEDDDAQYDVDFTKKQVRINGGKLGMIVHTQLT
ncbi:unnamed protein product, partial [Didymodactylos carnosus]